MDKIRKCTFITFSFFFLCRWSSPLWLVRFHWSGLDILLSAGSSYLVLGRMGRTQSRGRPLKYPWYWGLNAVIGFTVISSYFAKKHLFFCEILLWRLSTVYRYVCIPYELTYHSPLDNFKWIFLSFKDLLLRKYAFLLNFFYQIIPIEIKDILFYFPTKKVYLLLNSFQYKVSSD